MNKYYEAPELREELLSTNAIMDSEGTADDPWQGVDDILDPWQGPGAN